MNRPATYLQGYSPSRDLYLRILAGDKFNFQKVPNDFPYEIDVDSRKLQEQQKKAWDSHGKIYLDNIADAIRYHNVDKLSVFLGPALHLPQHHYLQTLLAGFADWSQAILKVDFDLIVFYTVAWFCCFRDYKKVWEELKKNPVPIDEKIQQLYNDAMTNYNTQGIVGYARDVSKNPTELTGLANPVNKPTTPTTLWNFLAGKWDELRLRIDRLDPEENLIDILRNTVKQAFNQSKTAAPHHNEDKDEEKELESLFQAETRASHSTTALSHPIDINVSDDESPLQNQLTPAGFNWHKETSLIPQKAQPQIETWLREIEKIIHESENILPEILFKICKMTIADIASCVGIRENQRVAYEKYKIQERRILENYRRFATTWFQENNKHLTQALTQTQIETLINEIISSGIGSMSPDDPKLRFSDALGTKTNLSLSHLAMAEFAEFKWKKDLSTRSSQIVMDLIGRGALLSTPDSADQTPLIHANILPSNIPKEWLLAVSASLSAPTATTYKAQKLIQNEISWMTHFFWGLFYNKKEIQTVVEKVVEGQRTLHLVHLPETLSTLQQMLIQGRGIFVPPPQQLSTSHLELPSLHHDRSSERDPLLGGKTPLQLTYTPYT